jgi:integrase
MSLFLRGNVWWIELRDPTTGVVFRETTRLRDRKEAVAHHERRKAEVILNGLIVGSGRRTWDEAAERWIAESEHKRDLDGDIAKLCWLKAFFGGRLLASLGRDEIMGVLRSKAVHSSNSTANRYLSLVRAILRRAANEWGWLNKVPVLKPFKEPPGRDRWLRPEEIERLLAELPEYLRDITAFALCVGQRQGALRRLTWDRVDFERRFCWIDHATSKSGKPIHVPLNDEALAILKRQVGKHERIVFTHTGTPITTVNNRAWRAALKRAGIHDFRWHDTRHTWASYHAMNGTPIDVLKELGGWSSLDMPMRYRHLSNDALRKFVDNAALANGPLLHAPG